MPRNLWSHLAKGTSGFFLGILFWWALSAPYTWLLSSVSEPLIRMTERPAVTHLVPNGAELTIDRTDFPRDSPRPALLILDLTTNFVVLTALFAMNRQPLSDRNISRLSLAAGALVIVHVAAVVINVQSIYALQLGAWSERNYGVVARNFWGAAAHFYGLVGAFGASFALWWVFRPAAGPAFVRFARH